MVCLESWAGFHFWGQRAAIVPVRQVKHGSHRREGMARVLIVFITLATLSAHTLLGQCSDAGVCSVGSGNAVSGHHVGASYVLGKSGKTDGLNFHSIHFEGGIQLLPDSRLTILLPWSRTNGPSGTASGIGDLTLLWNQTVWNDNGNSINAQVGGKFATGEVNSGNLSQSYQPGLGTNDLLFGVTYEADPWTFAVGYQVSRGRSNNQITRLKRGDDALARIGYAAEVNDLTVGLELLLIKRLHKSSVLDMSGTGGSSFVDIPGSDQFQANMLTSVSLPISAGFSLRGFVAVPLRTRDINVDGLTRSFTVALGLKYSL